MAEAELIAARLLEMLGRDLASLENNMRLELNRLNSSIEDAGKPREWANRMREVSDLLEDVVDELCTFPAAGTGFLNYLGRVGAGLLAGRRDSAYKIKSIKALLLDTHRFPNRSPNVSWVSGVNEEQFLEGISPVVGVLLRNYLVGQDPAYLDVAVLGVGGIGRSTFAKVYNDEVVKIHFDIRVWVVVPCSFDTLKNLKFVARQICTENFLDDIDTMSFAEIIAAVRRFLELKRYFLVFNDVPYEEFWNTVKGALPDDNNGSRIIVTTQSERVASACRVSFTCPRPRPFSEEMAQALFLEGISPLNYFVGQDPTRLDVAVFGASEIGRSIIAKYYDDEVVKKHFGIRVWIAAPTPNPDPDMIENDSMMYVARQICAGNRQANNDIDTISLSTMVAAKRFLQSKRYLLVFEDVRDVEFWYALRSLFPDSNNGSRIVITTQSLDVALACQAASSTDLFLGNCKVKFSDLLGLQKKIIQICKKLPLAIVAVAGLLLSADKFQPEWRNLVQNFSFEVEPSANLKCLSEILALGFFTLPHNLKSCFLYFSLFPKESLIPNAELFKLWIAEGFVEKREGQSSEEVGQEYLNELISRNLVQAREGFYGIEQFSRVHCLMHEILHKEAAERSFCRIWGLNEVSRSTVKSRRILIYNHNVDNALASIAESQVRTIFLSNVGFLSHSCLVGLFEKYKLLTLLDIENSPLELIPEEVGNLLCLKYLSLRNTQIRMLPKSVGKLLKLQTLDLTRTLLFELPMEIFLLRNLRHLLASRCDNKISLDPAKGVKIKPGIGYLVNLLTLTVMEAHLSGMDVIRELKKLKKLRSLSVSRLTTELSSALCACIYVMNNLVSLRLHSMNNEFLDLQKIAIPPPKLEHLVLKGLIQKLPNWISCLQNLKVLCLSLSMLADDPLQCFCLLPYLESLWLYRAYEGQRLHFPKSGFPSLKLVVLRDLQGLEAVEIEEGALPLLEELRIGPSPLLNEVPSGLIYLKSLKSITFYDMPSEFVLRMKSDGGSEYWKVQRIQSVFICYRDEGSCYVSY